MNLPEIILIAVALAMDCFAVSICCGLSVKDIRQSDALKLGIFFGSFQGLMALAGWLGGTNLVDIMEDYTHWIAFFLLILIGGKMLIDGLKNGECNVADIRKLRVVLMLSIATSIDALAIGVSFAFLETAIIIPVILIGVVSFIFAYAGTHIGDRVGEKFEGRIEIIGGLILIAIGIKVLAEGLFL